MAASIIRVENLSKRYIISHQGNKGDGLRHCIEEMVRSPLRWLRSSLKTARNGHSGNGAGSPLKNKAPTREEFWALKDVNFEINQGEVVGIIGRNGAGKSTLLKLLSRITEPTTGRITINGRVASLLEVGTGFHPELTGRENIFLNGAILGMTKLEIKKKFDEIVAFAEIEKFLDTPVKRYSSGMYVRLAFAVAAHLEPEILIVDEVLAVGDVKFQKKCLGKMHKVADSGRTILFVSHNMVALEALCSRAVLLNQGKVISQGQVAPQVARYLEMAESQRNVGADGPLNLAGGVSVLRFALVPAILASAREARIHLELLAQEPTRYDELTILIYSAFGVRVGIVDLRASLNSLGDVALRRTTLVATLKTMPLVEGDYFLGLWIRSIPATGEFLNLAKFTVSSTPSADGVVPYPAAHRGTVEFEFKVKLVGDPPPVSGLLSDSPPSDLALTSNPLANGV